MKNKILKLNTNLKWEEIVFEADNNTVGYEVLREAIGGYIEHVTFNLALDKCGIDVWIDEEGKLKDLKLSTVVLNMKNNDIVEVLAGPLVFTAKKNYDGQSYGLTDGQIEIIKQVFNKKACLSVDGVETVVAVLPYK